MIPKSKLKKLSTMLRPKGLEDVLQIGKFKNCRVGFVAKTYPEELQSMIDSKMITINKHVQKVLDSNLKKQANKQSTRRDYGENGTEKSSRFY